MCFGWAEVGTALVAAAPMSSAKPKMFAVICRSTTADSSLTLPCCVCRRAINVLKQACTTLSADMDGRLVKLVRCSMQSRSKVRQGQKVWLVKTLHTATVKHSKMWSRAAQWFLMHAGFLAKLHSSMKASAACSCRSAAYLPCTTV